jgi:TonB-dependent receptor
VIDEIVRIGKTPGHKVPDFVEPLLRNQATDSAADLPAASAFIANRNPKHASARRLMNPFSLLANFFRRIARTAWLLPLVFSSLFAQTTGGITGRVYDEGSGKSLQGAVVTVRGTNLSDYTDSDGRFSLSPVGAGPVTLDIEYVGLDPLTREVTVPAGGSTTVSAALKSTVLQLATFEVKEAARGQALAINQQKTAAGILNIVSEEMFGNMPSGNIGYALQRLPGISVDEDQDGSPNGINLRGVPGEYNSLQIDGNRIPNPGGTSRSGNPKNLMADGITNIEVIKAATPDRDGDAIGGIINIVSRTAFQRDGREYRLVASGSYNDLSEKWGYNARLTYSDIFSVAGKEKNLGVSVTVSKYTTDRYSENADIDWVFVTPANNPTLGLQNTTKFLEATHAERSFRTTHTTGVNASIDFRTDEHNSFYFRPYWSHYDQNSQTFETDWDIDTRFQDEVGGRKTYAFLSPDGSRGRGTPGANGSRSTLGYIGTDDDSHNDLWSYSAGGRHELGTNTISHDFNYSTSTYVRPNFVEFNMRLDPITQGYYVMEYDASNRLAPKINILNGLSPTDFSYARQGPTNLIIVPRTKEEEIYSARGDWEKKFIGDRVSHTLKAGAKYRSSELFYNQEDARFQIAANSAAAQAFPFQSVTVPTGGTALGLPRYLEAQPKAALATLNTAGWAPLEPASFNGSNLADYTAKEETTAGFLMDTLKFGRHTVIGGVRWEQNQWKRTNKKVVTTLPGPVLSTIPVSSSVKYDVWLPGLHFRHELARNLILRESFNKSYGRPSINDISRGRNQSVAVSGVITISEGNPLLQPSESDNYDIQLEYYTARGGLYSVSLFHKDIKNFTFTNVIRFNQLDAQDRPIEVPGGANTYTQPVNGPGAKNTGVELIARQRLFFLPGPLKGLSADVSATFTESDATIPGRESEKLPLRGFSEYLFTSSLDYAWGNFRARVDYRYRADYIEGLDASAIEDEWFSAREQVDAEIGYRIRKGLSLFATGTNLTHRPQVSYTGTKEFPEDVSYSGRKYTFGVEYKF